MAKRDALKTLSVAERQLLLQGLHIIGEQDRVEHGLVDTYHQLRQRLADTFGEPSR